MPYYSNCYEMVYRFNKRNEFLLYLSVNVFSTEVLIGDTIFYDRHFTCSSEPREGPVACGAREYLHLIVILRL